MITPVASTFSCSKMQSEKQSSQNKQQSSRPRAKKEKVKMMKNKSHSLVGFYHFKLLAESYSYLSDANSDEFLKDLMTDGKSRQSILSKPLDNVDRAALDLILHLEESFLRKKVQKPTVGCPNLDSINKRDLLPDMGLDINHLINVYLKD